MNNPTVPAAIIPLVDRRAVIAGGVAGLVMIGGWLRYHHQLRPQIAADPAIDAPASPSIG